MAIQLVGAGVGVWLMFAPALFSLGGGVSDLLWLLGPLAASFGVMATSAVLRGLRMAQVPIGLAALVGPWLLGSRLEGILAAGAAGVVLIALGLVPSEMPDRFGGGWRALFR